MAFPISPQPRVSILLPTLNAEHDLERLLPALAQQELAGGFELRVVDSDSDDCTRQLLRRAGVPVRRIERALFRHGRTRNELAAEAQGEFLVFLSQDALPSGTDFLQRLLEPFDDQRLAGCTTRVLPFEQDDVLTARTVLAAPEAREQAVVRDLSGVAGFWELEPGARAAYLRFNNVASCIRRSVFEQLPFPDVPFGEDAAWAARALTAGWKVGFHSGAVVQHAHRYGAMQAFERYRIDAAFHRRIHGYRIRPSLRSVARGFLFEFLADCRHVRSCGRGLPELLRSPGLRAGQVLGQYFGSRGWNPGVGSGATRKFS